MFSHYARSASQQVLRTRHCADRLGWRSVKRAVALETLEHRRLLAQFTLDFETDGFGNPTTPGQEIDVEYAGQGILFSSGSANHPLVIFDSANPTGGDIDLGTPNEDFGGGPGVGNGGELGEPGENNAAHGKVLIIQETIGGQPDDHEDGGQMFLDFDHAIDIVSVSILDVDGGEDTTTIKCFDENGVQIGATIFANVLGDNSYQNIQVNKQGVHRMRINSPGSFAIPNIVYEDEPPEEHLHGRMTGGGSIFLPPGAVGGNAGTRVTHGFQLHCAEPPETINNRLQINWGNPSNRFHLLTLNEVECFDDPNIVQAPPDAPIDRLDGVGIGRFSGKVGNTSYNKVEAEITFSLVDAGEPGTSDTSHYRIVVLDGNKDGVANDPVVALDTLAPQFLDRGNHQAHAEIPRLTSSSLQVNQAIAETFSRLDSPKMNDTKTWTEVTTLLGLFAELETTLSSARTWVPTGSGSSGSLSGGSTSVYEQLETQNDLLA